MEKIVKNAGGGVSEEYPKPEMEIIELNEKDIITGSNCGGCGSADFDGYSMPVCTPDCSPYNSCSSYNTCEDVW